MPATEGYFGLKRQLGQNLEDCLSEFLCEELFYPIGSQAHRIHLTGGVIDGASIPSRKNDPLGNADMRPEDRILFWGCGARGEGGLTPEQWRRTQVLSVRGPLSASELRLGTALPQGNPALLLPALYRPAPVKHGIGSSVCIPHFSDERSDAELLAICGCDIVLRCSIISGAQDVRGFIDIIAAADFVLSAELHGAVIAAAYERPFGFWDNGQMSAPFEWADFAASAGFPVAFYRHLGQAKPHYETVTKGRLRLPTLLDSLAVAPLLPRPDALLKILRHELARLQPDQMLAALDRHAARFEQRHAYYAGAVHEVLTSHKVALAAVKDKAKEALVATERARREGLEAQTALQHAQREAAEFRRAATAAQSAVKAMQRSSSWRLTAPIRAVGYLAKRQFGRALLEMGMPLNRVEALAARLGHTHPSKPAGLHPADPLHPTGAATRLPAHAQRIYLALKARAETSHRPDRDSPRFGAGKPETIAKASMVSLIDGQADKRPRLAFVSPLPPDQTGIADYSAELLPELEKYYRVDLIVDQASASKGHHRQRYQVHDGQWLRDNVQKIDRVIYHIGNSAFHKEMLDLLEEIPGVVVLHDFFLGHLLANSEVPQFAPNRWVQALYQSHGYDAVAEYYRTANPTEVLFKYPANYPVLENALGIIVHSEASRQFARTWYGEDAASQWRVIPLLRKINRVAEKTEARGRLGLGAKDFVVCSFGDTGATKLNHRLLEAWFKSELSRNARCVLLFVGQIFNGEYETGLRDRVAIRAEGKNIRFTGRTDAKTYKQYLAAADLGVQLRTLSRGETSAAVLDCLSHAMPTIVNANGAMAELPPDAVWLLPNEFDDEQLIEALEGLWRDEERRTRLGSRAFELAATKHDPGQCGRQYADAIELFHKNGHDGLGPIREVLQKPQFRDLTDEECRFQALRLAPSLAGDPPARRIFLDITATARSDIKTGIERVARALTVSILKSPPLGYRIEPVYLTNDGGEWQYRCAINYTLGLLGHPNEGWRDELVIPHQGDVLVVLDLSGDRIIKAAASGVFDRLRSAGVSTYSIVYDLLPIQLPEYFPDGASENHAKWLEAVVALDGAICISKFVADELTSWLDKNDYSPDRPFKITWSHLGADVENSAPSTGLPANAGEILRQLNARRTFLMVGTIEPRKGYLQVIEAFSRLWKDGHDINLVVVGKEGWKDLPEDLRRTIPTIVNRLNGHAELGRRLFWLEGISDEYLEKVYAAANCMIIASENEGFGLPVIEAARHGLPILARDIEVFREVAGPHADYFSAITPATFADVIVTWLAKYEAREHPRSSEMPWLTWEQSARRLLQIVLQDDFPSGFLASAGEVQSECNDKATNAGRGPEIFARQTLLP